MARIDDSWEDVCEVLVAADARPSPRGAVVELVLHERICSQFEKCGDGVTLPRLRGEVDCGDAFAVARSAEGASLIRVGAEFHERAY